MATAIIISNSNVIATVTAADEERGEDVDVIGPEINVNAKLKADTTNNKQLLQVPGDEDSDNNDPNGVDDFEDE